MTSSKCARSISTAWQDGSTGILGPRDVICSLASPSVDYAILELATIAGGAVPVAPSAAVAEWTSIVSATRPRVLAVGMDLVEIVVKALPPDLLPATLTLLGQGRPSRRVDQAVHDADRMFDTPTGVHSLDRIGRDLPAAPLHVPAPDTERAGPRGCLSTTPTRGQGRKSRWWRRSCSRGRARPSRRQAPGSGTRIRVPARAARDR